MTADHRTDAATKRRVQAQFAGAGDAYIRSATHAAGTDLRRMVEFAAPRPSDRLLDVATGGGHVLHALAPSVRLAVGADLTLPMLHHARDFIQHAGFLNTAWLAADAEHLPFADHAFDLVTCRIAPHHFPRPDRFVAEVARVLDPTGRFVLVDGTVPAGPLGDLFNQFETRRDPSHVRSLTIPEWTALLAANGFHLQTVESFPKRHDFDAWTARARMSPAAKADLAAFLLAAGPAALAAFHVDHDGPTIRTFTDTKTLFLATPAP